MTAVDKRYIPTVVPLKIINLELLNNGKDNLIWFNTTAVFYAVCHRVRRLGPKMIWGQSVRLPFLYLFEISENMIKF